jgi:lysozyme
VSLEKNAGLLTSVNNLQPSLRLYTSLKLIETLVSPARHLPADPPGVITGGYGRTHGVREGMLVPVVLAEQWLKEDVDRFAALVNRSVRVPLTQDEFDALVHFAFNIGPGDPNRKPPKDGFLTSTLLRLLNAGQKQAAAKQFERWKFSNGMEQAGLIARRRLETAWFSGDMAPMLKAVRLDQALTARLNNLDVDKHLKSE